jgi:hypothetical protein
MNAKKPPLQLGRWSPYQRQLIFLYAAIRKRTFLYPFLGKFHACVRFSVKKKDGALVQVAQC